LRLIQKLKSPSVFVSLDNFTLQVQVNGFISLGSPGNPQYPAWYPRLNQNLGHNSVIAPFWTDIDLRDSDGKIYLGIISRYSAGESVSSKDAEVYEAVRQLVLHGYGDSSFVPLQIVTVTWMDVPPHDYKDQVHGLMLLGYHLGNIFMQHCTRYVRLIRI